MCTWKMVTGYIYKITNLVNNKIYIGQTRVSVEYRFKCHISTSKSLKHHNYNGTLYKAFRKYGISNFKIETIEKINSENIQLLQEQLDYYERFYIKKFNSCDCSCGYNCTRGGQFPYSISKLEDISNLQSNLNKVNQRQIWNLNEIIILDKYAEVILYDKNNVECARVKIDIDDINLVKDIKWHIHKCNRGIYAKTNGKIPCMHNLVMNPPSDKIVIHLNNDGLDNRKSNLQIVSKSKKQQLNKIPKNNKSGVKGVWFCKDRNKWQAQITIKNKQKSLGRFDTYEDAVAARLNAEKQYY